MPVCSERKGRILFLAIVSCAPTKFFFLALQSQELDAALEQLANLDLADAHAQEMLQKLTAKVIAAGFEGRDYEKFDGVASILNQAQAGMALNFANARSDLDAQTMAMNRQLDKVIYYKQKTLRLDEKARKELTDRLEVSQGFAKNKQTVTLQLGDVSRQADLKTRRVQVDRNTR